MLVVFVAWRIRACNHDEINVLRKLRRKLPSGKGLEDMPGNQIHHQCVREKEDQHAQGYARIPVMPGEFDAWLSEQDWGTQ